MKKLRLGTRRSALAQAQSQGIAHALCDRVPELEIEIVLITTSGDESTSLSASAVPGGLKTLFTKELEDALLANQIDFAVHSMKDLPATLPKGLAIGAVPLREDPRDAWVSKTGTLFQALPKGARVGTGAIRRQSQLRHLRSDLEYLPIRGNVDTRLQKLADGEFDGLVLACAGLKRLRRDAAITDVFTVEQLTPAVGQGALALEIREADTKVKALVGRLNDRNSEAAVLAERSFLEHLGGSCQTPIAAYASKEGCNWIMDGVVASFDGKMILKEQRETPSLKNLGKTIAEALLARGAGRLLKETLHEPLEQ